MQKLSAGHDVSHRLASWGLFADEHRGGVGLLVHIDDQHTRTLPPEAGSKVHHGGGLPNPALLVGDSDDLHGPSRTFDDAGRVRPRSAASRKSRMRLNMTR